MSKYRHLRRLPRNHAADNFAAEHGFDLAQPEVTKDPAATLDRLLAA